MRRSHPLRMGAYGPARGSSGPDRDDAAFPLRLTSPADVPAMTSAAAELAAQQAPPVATPPAEEEEEVWPYWSLVPVELVDLDSFDDQGEKHGICLDRARIVFDLSDSSSAEEGGRA